MSDALHHPLPSAVDLMAKPALSWSEFWLGILGIPEATGEELVREKDGPKFFLLGRRRYIRKADALAWIDQMAARAAYVPRRYNRRGVQ
ncbi:hypothetical protein GBK02_10025 [Dechloromonas sp. TW-R-39-2]|uniref:hypothetical protein n=1 Tax=Dechloromonas sp. TW-R-39-2 TaxID=2654218 RepID=UPI00193EC189|nr:hypothetical protein [Dechloromonas sp. TW-R-39-2]QRM19715.1 hypothetical protein GBK02_10025 [Dechloromonas sp. TW-R-39-2]